MERLDQEGDLFDRLRELRGRFRGTAVIHYGSGPDALDIELVEKARGEERVEHLLKSRVSRVARVAG
ncbi:MAG: hypothetical protein FJX77_03090 [Armatimonadetes bacterium]|nr:hypothetical protein [Candidatus Handelsmanbacteria bacterium]MBM3457508.1 hypothetical protein [Armatimonadota bacterium]